MSPRKANTDKKLSRLLRDNIQAGESDILVHEDRVAIWPDSTMPGGWVTISKKSFNKMIDWYNKEQKIKY